MASPGCGELRYHLLKRYSRWARSSSGVTLTKRLKISGKRADSASQVKQTPDSRGYQPALTETTLKPNAPQMRSGATGDASAEAHASTNSVPRKTQNVKSESKGNAEGVLSNWLLRKHKAGAPARRGILIIRKIYMCPAGSPAGHS